MGDRISLNEIAKMVDTNGIVGNKDGKIEGENEIKFFEWNAKKEGYDTLEIQNFYKQVAKIKQQNVERKEKDTVQTQSETIKNDSNLHEKAVVTKPQASAKKPATKKPVTTPQATVPDTAAKKAVVKSQATTRKPANKKTTVKSQATTQKTVVGKSTVTKPQTTQKKTAANKSTTTTQKPVYKKQQAVAQNPAAKKPVSTKPQANTSKPAAKKSVYPKQEKGVVGTGTSKSNNTLGSFTVEHPDVNPQNNNASKTVTVKKTVAQKVSVKTVKEPVAKNTDAPNDKVENKKNILVKISDKFKEFKNTVEKAKKEYERKTEAEKSFFDIANIIISHPESIGIVESENNRFSVLSNIPHDDLFFVYQKGDPKSPTSVDRLILLFNRTKNGKIYGINFENKFESKKIGSDYLITSDNKIIDNETLYPKQRGNISSKERAALEKQLNALIKEQCNK